MFDRNQWLEWAKNSQNNPEMKDSQFNVRKNDQTKGYLYEDTSAGALTTNTTGKGPKETDIDNTKRLERIAAQSKKIPSKIGRKVFSAGARAVTDPEIRNQAKTVATWKLADILVDKFSNRRKNDPDSPTRIIPNPVVDESNDLDEAAFLLPLLAPLLSMGSAVGGAAAAAGGALGTAAGGLAARAAGSAAAKGIAKFATAGAKRLATTGKRLITKPKRMGGKNLAMQGGLGFAPTAEGQENLAVSSWRKSIQQLDEQQLDEFLGRLLKGAGRVFERKPKMTAQSHAKLNIKRPRGYADSYTSGVPKITPKVPITVGGFPPAGIPLSPARQTSIMGKPSFGSKVRDYAKLKKGTGDVFGIRKGSSALLNKVKQSKTFKNAVKDPLGAAGNVGKEYLKYKMMGLAMGGGGQPKDPMATQAQSSADAQAAATDRIDQQRIARKPSPPLATIGPDQQRRLAASYDPEGTELNE